jgi:hypothetical protein
LVFRVPIQTELTFEEKEDGQASAASSIANEVKASRTEY